MNFYSHAPNTGIQYHPTKGEAKTTAAAALRELLHNGVVAADIIATVTWGEVRERAASASGNAPTLRNQLRLTYEAANPQIVDGKMLDAQEPLGGRCSLINYCHLST